jgi:hypothetical protein
MSDEHLSFNPIFGSYWLVGALALALVVLSWMRPSFARISRARRLLLVAFRLAVIGLVLLAMLRPTIVNTTRKKQTSLLLILYDQSRSMTLPSAAAGTSRWQAQIDSLKLALAELSGVEKELEIKVYGYDSQLHPTRFEGGQAALPDKPIGDQTDIGSPLYDAIRRDLGKRLAGAVLLGDGAQTAFAPQVEVTEAGRELARLNCPLYTVAFGPAGDTAQSRDVAIDNLPEQYSVFVKNELMVRGVLRVRGYVNQAIPVELLLEDAAGQKRSLGTARLTSREDGQQLPVEISFTPDRPGRFKLTLKAAEQPGELVTRNNELSAYLTVLEGGLRTVYLYGDLLGEQRLLRRTIDLSPDIQLDDVYMDPKNSKQWPLSLADHIQPPTFDALLIESVDASAISEEAQREITSAVERGRGLMMIGGFSSFGAGGYFGKPLADALPIRIERFERQDLGFDKTIIRELHWWEDLSMLPVRPHPVTRLAPDAQNLDVWKSLPPLKGANRFRNLKPLAQVLCETSDGKPLLVAGEFGQGRVLAFAGNGTHRWWQLGRQAEYRRFWRQAILWLSKRDEAERQDVWVQLAQRRFPVGARITFTAGAKSAAGEVIRGASFTAELVSPGGVRKPLAVSSAGDEVSGATDSASLPGDYLIEVKATVGGQVIGTGQANFQVLDRDLELSNPAADYDLLARLALQTKEAGGKLISPEELPKLMRDIKDRRHESEIEVQSKWQLGDTSLDAWLFLIALVGVLTAEWVVRKKWGLV